MSRVLITKSILDELADVIAAKGDEEVPLTLEEMIEIVEGLRLYEEPSLQTVTKTYTPGKTAVTDTITPGNGYDGIEEVDVTVSAVPMAEATGTVYASGFSTKNNKRVWVQDIRGYAESAGWVDGGLFGTSYEVEYNAVPANTSVTPTESQQTVGGANYMMEGAVTIGAVPSNYVGSGITRCNANSLSGAFDDGVYDVNVTAGYYAAPAHFTVPNGTEGTPSASKGSVSNHSVSVTPSVTNSAGYILGGTKTGTAVSVSASELVSGTLAVDSSGTKNVANYEYASVPAGTAGTPSASKGSVSNHSVSVTPSVTNSAGWISSGTKTGTAVSVSASELVSGNLAISQNGSNIDVTNYATVSVAVEGSGSGMQIGTATATPSSASASISFTGLSGEPTSFAVCAAADLATGASPFKTACVVFDGTSLHGQTVTNTNNAQATYDGTNFTKSYSNGTLTITGSTYWQAVQYKLVYTYGGTSANIATADHTDVGSGITALTFSNLTDEPDYWAIIFESGFGTSSGYQRAMAIVYDGSSIYGLAMDSGAKAVSSWSQSYSNGTLTVTSTSTSNGGYFHSPGTWHLVYGIGGEAPDIETESLTVTVNGTYTAPSGKAYTPVIVNVAAGGSANFATATMTNSSNQNTSISFTLPSGRTPKAFFCRLTAQITRNSNSRYYYVENIRWDGSSSGGVAGRCFYMSSGQLTNITSGYSHSQSGTTFTLTTTGTRSASPGSFYNGQYELVYIY